MSMEEDFQCALFLFNLNPNYAVFKDHILANESFPSAANVYSPPQRASIVYTPFVSKDASTIAFVSNGRGGSVRGGRCRSSATKRNAKKLRSNLFLDFHCHILGEK
ncbi:hypothetical protein IFM89_019297 [Coptis chinensis]|uniref:Uncharacterized protein n=1 Tax=Coptis chinensis TaxID=261450 RepID=A0A835IAM2_9MAGN|nr:hypothetical protein IFM89_019297 [Coptis chinensis]